MSNRSTILFVGLMLVFFVPLVWFVATADESKRAVRMERQLELIRSAQTIDDLRPLLEEIVKRSRHDYK